MLSTASFVSSNRSLAVCNPSGDVQDSNLSKTNGRSALNWLPRFPKRNMEWVQATGKRGPFFNPGFWNTSIQKGCKGHPRAEPFVAWLPNHGLGKFNQNPYLSSRTKAIQEPTQQTVIGTILVEAMESALDTDGHAQVFHETSCYTLEILQAFVHRPVLPASSSL